MCIRDRLRAVGMTKYRTHSPNKLSGGQTVSYTHLIMVALLTVICIVAGIYTGYHFGFEQKTKVYIVGAILFWAAGIDVIVRLVSCLLYTSRCV